MYAELLDIVRGAEQPEDSDVSGTSTEATRYEYAANMPVVVEESEAEYPSFSENKKNMRRGDSEFEEVIKDVLEENKREKSPFKRDDLSDDDDDDLSPARVGGNPLKDFTFVGGDMTLVPKKKEDPKKLDSITAIRDYLESELS